MCTDLSFYHALETVTTTKIRLVTLGGHSKGRDIMGSARKMYEKNGFVMYQRETGVNYGHSATIDVLYYQKFI